MLVDRLAFGWALPVKFTYRLQNSFPDGLGLVVALLYRSIRALSHFEPSPVFVLNHKKFGRAPDVNFFHR
jgi:hypothetical protein